MKKSLQFGALGLGAVLMFSAAPVAAAEAPSEDLQRRECIFEIDENDNDIADRINALRQKRERTGLNLDQVLTTSAFTLSEVIASEDALAGSKARLQTRDHTIEETVATGGLIMKGKSLDAIWRRMSKNSFPRSVILRAHYRHMGINVVEANERFYMVVLFGGEALTPIGC